MWQISKKAQVKVSADLDAERAKAESTRKEYINKIEVHTARTKHSLGLDKMLGDKKVQLNGREWYLDLHEAELVEAQSWSLNPWDNREELMEFIKLHRCLKEAEVERVAEAGWLAILVRGASKVLVDLGMPPIPRIPWDPHMTDDVLEAVGTILECLWEAYSSGHDPWD
jgi:hypothetical protein